MELTSLKNCIVKTNQRKDEYTALIEEEEQLKKLGASCDWSRTAFTMEDVRSESVIKVFFR